MKITALETITVGSFPNLVWVRVHTDEGIAGLGETYFGAKSVTAWIHESAAPVLIGRDPLQIERINADLTPYVGYGSGGVEMRGISAIDIALWDLLGKLCRQPIWQLLGGASRDRIRTYNTCAGYGYVRNDPDWNTGDWGLDKPSQGPYEDIDAFLHRADELALSLLEQGITGMKIWPFDFAATRSDGYHITAAELDEALQPFAKIRGAVQDKMDIMVELHGLWRFPAILKIAKALEPFDPYWFEDPLRPDSTDALADFARQTRVPVCSSETMTTLAGHQELLSKGISGIVMPDLVWCGGITVGRKIAALAQSFNRPVAPHDCTGPVAFMAACHFSTAIPNVLVQESVRAFYSGWYAELVTRLPHIEQGYILAPDGPGLGTDLAEGFTNRSDADVTISGKPA